MSFNLVNDEFQKRLLQTFRAEAQETVQAISAALVEMERAAPDRQRELIESVFRQAHNLKGAARSVDAAAIENVCQKLESIFARWKRQELAPSSALFDVLYKTADGMNELLSLLEEPSGAAQQRRSEMLISELTPFLGQPLSPPASPLAPQQAGPDERGDQPADKSAAPQTVRVSAERLDAILFQTEEMIMAKLAVRQRALELGELHNFLDGWKKEWNRIHSDVRVLSKGGQNNVPREVLTTTAEFMDWNQSFIGALDAKVRRLLKMADQEQRTVDGMVDTLLDDMIEALMLPFASLFETFPRMVRELSRAKGNLVELVIQGAEIQIDRRILQELKDPLIHLVRNAIDHGIETPEERARKNKRTEGRLGLVVLPKTAGSVEVILSDDGVGVDPVRIKAAALKARIISAEQAEQMTREQLLALAFESELSTTRDVSELSGRGLGLAIVRDAVEKLGGTVRLETETDNGTTFRMRLPLTLSRFRGLLVSSAGASFVIPSANVQQVLRVRPEEIKTVTGRDVIEHDGAVVALARLSSVLELPGRGSASRTPNLPVVVLGSRDNRVAFVVDDILNEQEVLMKPLGKQLRRVRNVSGATVLGSGEVVPILNPHDLMKSAVKQAGAQLPAATAVPRAKPRKRSVLVADDSITSRTLLKNILRAAGYKVSTAVDGVDALTQARGQLPDAVVSDVDMPRLNGFDLTAKIRAERKLQHLPVILVTGMELPQDRERGLEAGASAYLVKSSFDQSDLLKTLDRLI